MFGYSYINLISIVVLSNSEYLAAAPDNAKPAQKEILFTKTTETPVNGGSNPTVCPNGAQRFAAFCPLGTVLVSGQCAIDPPIQHISVNTHNWITLKPEIHQHLNSSNDHSVDLGTTPHLQCDFECEFLDSNEPAPVISDDAVIVATILRAGTPLE